jgi:hypothetical protein
VFDDEFFPGRFDDFSSFAPTYQTHFAFGPRNQIVSVIALRDRLIFSHHSLPSLSLFHYRFAGAGPSGFASNMAITRRASWMSRCILRCTTPVRAARAAVSIDSPASILLTIYTNRAALWMLSVLINRSLLSKLIIHPLFKLGNVTLDIFLSRFGIGKEFYMLESTEVAFSSSRLQYNGEIISRFHIPSQTAFLNKIRLCSMYVQADIAPKIVT